MKFAPILGSNLTGRIGGIVASHNSSGSYFRRFVMPVNPNTPGQQLQRNAFAVVSQSWRGLGVDLQKDWTTAGPQHTVPNSTGGSLILTGQQLYMRMNTLRSRLGLPLITVAPTTDEVPNISTPAIVIGLDGSVNITFDALDQWNETGGGILVSVSPLLSNGRNFNNQYVYVSGGEVRSPAPNPAAMQLVFSTLSGGRLTFRFSAVTPDGRLSDYLYVDATTPKQSVLTALIVTSATTARVVFNNPVTAANFAAGDFTGAWQTTVSAVAQGAGPNELALTGTVFASGLAFAMVPSGTAADYVPQAYGVTQ